MIETPTQIESKIKPVLFSTLAWQLYWFLNSSFVQYWGSQMYCQEFKLLANYKKATKAYNDEHN